MSTLIAIAAGSPHSINSSSAFGVVDITSLVTATTTATTVSTSVLASPNFNPGAITVDGCALEISTWSATAGTFTVELYNVTDAVSVATCTIGYADIVKDGTSLWYFFSFGSSYTLLAGKNYSIRLVRSASGSTVSIRRTATANNWGKMLRTTTTAAHTSADTAYILQELTGSGTATAAEITMDNTNSGTNYGAIVVGNGGALKYAYAGSTNYYLNMHGNLTIAENGIFTIGTSSNPIPSTSTAHLKFNSASAGQYVMNTSSFWGNIEVFGAEITNKYARIASNASAGATSITTDISTGWKSGDVIGIAPNRREAANATTGPEERTLSGDASGTTVTISSGLTLGRENTAIVQPHIVNLTRNVKIYGASSTNTGRFAINSSNSVLPGGSVGRVSLNHAEFYYLGTGTVSNSAVYIHNNNGDVQVDGCAIYNNTVSGVSGLYINDAQTGRLLTLRDNVYYNNSVNGFVVSAVAASHNGTGVLIENQIMVKCSFSTSVGASGNITNLVVSGASSNVSIALGTTTSATIFDGLLLYSCGNNFLAQVSGNRGINGIVPDWFTFDNVEAYLLLASSTGFATGIYSSADTVRYANGIFAGNFGTSIDLQQGPAVVEGCSFDGHGSFSAATGVAISTAAKVQVLNCDFGQTVAMGVADVKVGSTGTSNFPVDARVDNCMHSSAAVMFGATSYVNGFVGFTNIDGDPDNNRCYVSNGSIRTDTVISNTGTLSERLVPINANGKMTSSIKRIALNSGQTANFSVYVRKSVVGDGTAYNGNQPRLLVKGGIMLNTFTNSVEDTASGSAGSWEQLTGSFTATQKGVLELYVDCDGTTGWVNVDDWEVDVNNDPRSMDYWDQGMAFLSGEYNTSGGGGSGGGSIFGGLGGVIR